jgi:hypothetical protein
MQQRNARLKDKDRVPRIAVMSMSALPVNHATALDIGMTVWLCFNQCTSRVICTHCSDDIIINMESWIVCTYMNSSNRHL